MVTTPTAQENGHNLFNQAIADAVRPVIREEIQILLAPILEKKKEEEKPEVWTKKDACGFLGISRPTLDALVKEGYLHATHIGRRVYLDAREVRALVSAGRFIKFHQRKK